MSKFVVIVFPSEEQATKGAQLLDELNEEGTISLYATARLGKDAEGRITHKETSGRGPRGFVLGALAGALVGMLGGPPVAAVGAASGALMGGWRDAIDLGLRADFLDEVSRELKPGHWALVAVMDEEWVSPLDSAMEAIGGRVIRTRRAEFEDHRLGEEIEMACSELADYDAELSQAEGSAKAGLATRRKEVLARIEQAAERTEARIERLREETEAKIEALQERASDATAEGRKKIEARIEALRGNFKKRAEKLKKALEAARDALD